MNYYIDEGELEIAEKNIYTAIEIGTLIPLHGDLVFEKFYAVNAWTRDFLPNKNMRLACAKPIKTSFIKRLFGWLPYNPVSNVIDNILMTVTARRWRKSTRLKKLNSKGAIMAMAVNKHFSKPDPANFQNKLLVRYKSKVAEVLQEYENSLAH
jgi:hypothetical protein